MDLNRNQFLFLGVVILLIGLQVKYVSAYVLKPEATQFLAERTGQSSPAQSGSMAAFFGVTGGTSVGPKKVLEPPEWLGWCLISIGGVLVLHSLAMRRPD